MGIGPFFTFLVLGFYIYALVRLLSLLINHMVLGKPTMKTKLAMAEERVRELEARLAASLSENERLRATIEAWDHGSPSRQATPSSRQQP